MLLAMRHFPAGAEGQAYWYHLDGRGSVAGLTKHQGQSTHNYRYDAYGQLLPAHGNFTDPHNPYTFIGKEWDEHLGLYEFGVRLYDPWAGVWLTREPLPGQAWAPRTWHRYQYAYASPISYYDPYGLQVPPPECKPSKVCYTGTTGPYTLQSEPTIPLAEMPAGAFNEFCFKHTSSWTLFQNLVPGGKYGYGQLLAQGRWWSVYVPPMRFGIDYYTKQGFYYNVPLPYEESKWQTVARLQGITRLPSSWIDQIAVGLALRNVYPAKMFGPPAPLSVYQQLHMSEHYAWINEEASPIPLNIDMPAENFYDALAGAIQIAASITEAHTLYTRAYQVLLQTVDKEGEERAIIQTFYVYQDAYGYQITPRYLSVSSRGNIEEIPMVYPYASAVLTRPGPCRGSSTCYSTAIPFQLLPQP